MLFTRSWTKRPREALLQLDIGFILRMFSVGGTPPFLGIFDSFFV